MPSYMYKHNKPKHLTASYCMFSDQTWTYHELTATDGNYLDSFPSLWQSSMRLSIIDRLGAELILVAVLAVFLRYFCSARHLYTDYGV